ncbi:MAG: hypothetical protein HKO63_10485 [Acidimicrobiia bacterium]|nr:hypothetical protein [Acidimicrobiia bacterium]NNL13855.1 hypothetical protein [Acidimicrobiia bacterium]NNL98619.1 hypothetical protein [Acidimicrobiia bacterium]
MNRRVSLAILALVLAACAQVTVETTTLSDRSLPPATAGPDPADLEAAATEICTEHGWVGIAEPASFADEAAALGVADDVLAAAVHRRCPESFYEPLAKAEVDWCGDGLGFGQNFFRVVEAGVDLGIESFVVVDAGLISKAAARRVELSDYEVELLTAGLQTMSESSRFERDWAAACRSTL